MTAAKIEQRLVKEFVRSRQPNVNHLQRVADQIDKSLVFVQDWFMQQRRDTPKPRQPAAPSPVRSTVRRPRTRSRRQASPAQSASPARVRAPVPTRTRQSRTPVSAQPSSSAQAPTPARRSRTRSPRQSSPAPVVATTVNSHIFPRGSYDTLVRPLIEANQLPQMPWPLWDKMIADYEYKIADYSIVTGRTFKVTETLGGFQFVDGRWREIRNKVHYVLPSLRHCYPRRIANDLIGPPDDDENDDDDDDDDEDSWRKILIQKLQCGNCSGRIMLLRCITCFAGYCNECVVAQAFRKQLGARLNCPGCNKTGRDIFTQIAFPQM